MMAKMYHKLPSEILRIDDEYTAFCFDEASANIMAHIQSGEEPIWIEERKEQHYSSFTEMMNKRSGV